MTVDAVVGSGATIRSIAPVLVSGWWRSHDDPAAWAPARTAGTGFEIIRGCGAVADALEALWEAGRQLEQSVRLELVLNAVALEVFSILRRRAG